MLLSGILKRSNPEELIGIYIEFYPKKVWTVSKDGWGILFKWSLKYDPTLNATNGRSLRY